MAKKSAPSQATSLTLAKGISDEVLGWRNQAARGWCEQVSGIEAPAAFAQPTEQPE